MAAGTLVQAGPVSAASRAAPGLGGYQGSAAASGLHTYYTPEGLLPTAPPVDMGAPDAYATIASGPATFARGSVVDPGDLLANPDALLALGSSGYKSGTIPPYPYRATASSSTGSPTAESAPAPGLSARVSADQSGSAATSTMPGSATPALATFGSMTSNATTATDGSTVTVHARAEVNALAVLGVVTIDSVVTDLTVTSDGTSTTVTGGTTIGGARVLGTPVAIDDQGVHAPSGGDGPTTTTGPAGGLLGSVVTPATGNLNDVLANAGIRVTVAGAAPVKGATGGQIAADGLRIDLELSERTIPALTPLLAAVPYTPPLAPGAPNTSDIVKLARARHIVALQAGRSLVSLSARPARQPKAAAPASSPSPSPAATAAAPSSPAAPGRTAAARPASPSLSSAGGARASATPVDSEPGVPIGAGIGALALLALMVQPFIGDRLALASRAVLGADQLTSCPWEER